MLFSKSPPRRTLRVARDTYVRITHNMPSRTLTMGYPADARRRTPFPGSVTPLALAVFGLIVGGCAASGVPAHAAPEAAPADKPLAPVRGSFDRDWGERLLARVPVRLVLPDARGWHASASGTFTVLTHAGSRSSLALRVGRAARLVRPAACEAEARLLRPSLPAIDASNVVEERALAAPRGFDTHVVVAVEPRDDSRVHGVALAIGAATGRCYVAAFETEGDGPHAAEDVADRLAVVVSGVFETLHVPDAEERATPPAGVK